MNTVTPGEDALTIGEGIRRRVSNADYREIVMMVVVNPSRRNRRRPAPSQRVVQSRV